MQGGPSLPFAPRKSHTALPSLQQGASALPQARAHWVGRVERSMLSGRIRRVSNPMQSIRCGACRLLSPAAPRFKGKRRKRPGVPGRNRREQQRSTRSIGLHALAHARFGTVSAPFIPTCAVDEGLGYGRVRGGGEHHVRVSVATKEGQPEVACHVAVAIPAGARLRPDVSQERGLGRPRQPGSAHGKWDRAPKNCASDQTHWNRLFGHHRIGRLAEYGRIRCTKICAQTTFSGKDAKRQYCGGEGK